MFRKTTVGKVLVVEDSLVQRKILAHCLERIGLEVACATSSLEAKDYLQQSDNPDLIILDVMLPDQSGFSLCQEIKKNARTNQIPIVMCSSNNAEVNVLCSTMLGADAYILKPVDWEKLVSTVQKLLKI